MKRSSAKYKHSYVAVITFLLAVTALLGACGIQEKAPPPAINILPCDPSMEEERAWADRLENEFGVTILISNQCDHLADYLTTEYSVASTQGLEQEQLKIDNALYTLETELQKYPSGFFQQMKKDSKTGGVVYCLTGEFEGLFLADGLFERYYSWYIICLDITRPEMKVTLHHETYHAIESFIMASGHFAQMNVEKWMALNPPEFQYSYNYYGWNKDYWYTFLYDNNHPVYFYDCYSKIDPKEDRARLFECVMCPYDRFYGKVLEYEHIISKVNYMAAAIRESFDTTGWENVIWEEWME